MVKAYAKKLYKDNPNSSFDIEKYAQGQMPKVASSNADAKLAYLNGHFGYFQKCIISTNALGVVRNVNFYNPDNNIDLDLRTEEIKDLYDSKSLIPSLETFFQLHPSFSYKYFLGDTVFNVDNNYTYLHKRNIMPIISLNPRNSSDLPQPNFNEVGCSHLSLRSFFTNGLRWYHT